MFSISFINTLRQKERKITHLFRLSKCDELCSHLHYGIIARAIVLCCFRVIEQVVSNTFYNEQFKEVAMKS